MSDKKSPQKEKNIFLSLNYVKSSVSSHSSKKPDQGKASKRKLFSHHLPESTSSADANKPAQIGKRRSSADPVSPQPSLSANVKCVQQTADSSVTSSAVTPGKARTPQAPLSERQQIAKIMQQYAAEESHSEGFSPKRVSSPPSSAGKKTPLDKKMNKRNEKGETLLHVAAIKGDLKQTKKLLKAGCDVNVKDNAGWTPLHEACNHGHFSVARQLLKNGANVNVLGLENDTPLHDASVNGHVKLIHLLLCHGANPLQSNMSGKAPIDVARDDNILKILKSETIASCSSSESVTSEIRSPTSPDSNLSEDEQTEDVKKKKDSSDLLFMPRATTMISSIGSGGASSSSHSPPSSTTPTKLPITDPYAYHEESDIADLPTPSSNMSTSASRPHGLKKNIHVSHKMGETQPRLTMVFTHHKEKQKERSNVTSPKRSASSQIQHSELKKQKTLSDKEKSSDKHTSKTKFELEYQAGSSYSSKRSVSPCGSVSSQDSDLYDPHLGGDSSHSSANKSKEHKEHKNDQPVKISSSEQIEGGKEKGKDGGSHVLKRNIRRDSDGAPLPKHPKKDHEFAKSKVKGIESPAPKPSVIKPASEASLFKNINVPKTDKKSAVDIASFQPDSQMPTLSQEGYSPVQFEINYEDLSDSDENSLQIDAGTTAVDAKTPLIQKNIQSQTSAPVKLIGGTLGDSDVSSSNIAENKLQAATAVTKEDVNPYAFSADSPCSITSYSYKHHQQMEKQERLEKKQERSSSVAAKVDKDKIGGKQQIRNDANVAKLPPATDQSEAGKASVVSKGNSKVHSTNSNIKGQPETHPVVFKNTAKITDVVGDQKLSDKKDTDSTIDVKPHIKIEVKDPFDSVIPKASESASDDVTTKLEKVKEETVAVEGQPLSIKIEKDRPIKLEKDDRSKSPKGFSDKDCTSRKHSPKYSESSSSSRSSPRPFTPKESSNSGIKTTSIKWDSNRASPKSDRDSPKSDKSDRSEGSNGIPKVPPLKIIMPPNRSGSNERPQSHIHTSTTHPREKQPQVKVNLPYVINPTQDSSGASLVTTTSAVAMANAASNNPDQPTPVLLVKSSRNSSRASSVASGEQDIPGSEKFSSSGEDPTGVGLPQDNSATGRRATRSRCNDKDTAKSVDGDNLDKADSRSDIGGDSKEEQSERRVTRSQMRQQGKEKKSSSAANNSDVKETIAKDEKEDKDITVGFGEQKDSSNIKVNSAGTSSCSATESSVAQTNKEEIAVHPRKRKALRQRTQDQSCSVDSSFAFFPKSNINEKTANPMEMFLDIRKKIAKRRNEMVVITPKAPTGFSNYLMVSCNYMLQGNSNKLNIPMLTAPNALEEDLKNLFLEQEQARYKLRMQHVVEREKLRLSIEQEVLRVHGRAARALANQTTPLSMCSILKDEEIYNTIDTEAEEKEKIGARSRYNGRQFLSWLQDVDDKYEKIKEATLLRHHHEAESLHAVQKLDWEWKLKEKSLCDSRSTPVIPVEHVPMVTVNDEFELLPS